MCPTKIASCVSSSYLNMALIHHSLGVLLFLIPFVFGDSCNSDTVCGASQKAIPDCESGKNSLAVDCLLELLKRCHRDKEAEVQLAKETLIQEAACKNQDLLKEYKSKPNCWLTFNECVAKFSAANIDAKSKTKEERCLELRKQADRCKEKTVSEDCKEMRDEFIEEAFSQTVCGSSCKLTLHLSLIISAFVTAIFIYRGY